MASLSLLACSLFVNAQPVAEASLLASVRYDEACVQWVDSVMQTLDRRARVAQLFMPVVSSQPGNGWPEKITKWVKEQQIGGLFFDKGSILDQARATNHIQSMASVPLMIAADAEWGLAMRLKDAMAFPRSTSIAAIQDSTLWYEYGAETARQLRAMGIQVNFAPVVDVNSNPANPVINTRAFGADAKQVARVALAYAQGLQDHGVMAVMKHFPGHGNTAEDSHEQLARGHQTRAAMDTVELLPFKHLIQAGIDGLMVGHLSVPALEKDVLLPSSQSRAITGALLHDSLGFNGLCFTDALVMKGTVSSYSGMNCIRSLQAGNDILLSPANLPADITAVVKAVEKGLLSDSLIDAKCRKLLTYKYALGLSKQQPIQLDSIVDVLNHEQAKALNLRLHVEAITLLRNQNDFLPLRHLDSKKTAVVLLGASDKNNAFVEQLKAYQENIDVYPVLAGNENDREDLAEQLKKYDRCIVAIYANTRQQQLWLARLRHLPHLALCFFSSPYSMALHGDILQEAEAVLCAYENSELSQKAAAQAIFGGNSIRGRLSAPIGKYYPCGWGLDTEKTRLSYLYPENVDMSSLRMMAIDSIVEDALQREVFPGCQVLVAKDGAVVWNKSYGYIDHEHSRAVSNDDIYDLASLTKAIACTPMIMSLAEQGRLHLDEAVSNYLPALQKGDKSDLSFRQMLYHESRLPSFVPFYQMLIDTSSYASPFFLTYRADSVHCMRFDENAWAPGSYNFYSHLVSSTAKDSFSLQVAEDFYVHDSFRDSVIRRINDADLLKRKRYVYSDLGYLLMGFAAENIARKTVEDYVFDEFYAPLGAYTTSYHPLKRFDASRIVPTTLDTCLRKQLLCGYTHDEAAAFLGGAAGNAGVFSNANDLAKVLQMYLEQGTYGGHRYFEAKTLRFFTSTRSKLSRRMLGFDAYEPNPQKKQPVCEKASIWTYGHVGFTGTCFWIDPVNRVVYIFLSNRVHPDRTNNALARLDIRPKIQAVIYESMEKK